MPIPKKNLLEAFQASARVEKVAAQSASPPATKAGGPFASAPSERRLEPPIPAEEAAPWHEDLRLRLGALAAGIALAAFFVGRASVSTAAAGTSPSSAPASSASREPGPAAAAKTPAGAAKSPGARDGLTAAAPDVVAQIGSQPANAAERALFDPKNLYTVKLVEYSKGRDDKLAAQTLAWLQQQSLPAVAQFQGARLYILLGAGAEQKDLDGLLARAKSMTGPPPLSKPKEFHDAYVVAIDRLVKR